MAEMNRNRLTALWLIGAALCAGEALAQNTAPADEESAKSIVATTVRSLGHSCEQPKRATRDPGVSLPDQAAWILECANARYWVRYDNDEPAEIRQLD
jgi:hypothetical protein